MKIIKSTILCLAVSFPTFSQNTFPASGNVGIGTTAPTRKLEIKQDEDPSSDNALMISEPNNSQKIYLHLADNASGEYGYLHLGGDTKIRGNGVHSSFDGNVGIGTTSPRNALDVNGTIRGKEVKVEASPWPDFVFEDGYPLKSLGEVEQFIKEKGHLPEVPTAQDVSENGISLGEMNAKLLQKIEELTLYAIESHEITQKLIQDVEVLKNQNNALKEKVVFLNSRLNK